MVFCVCIGMHCYILTALLLQVRAVEVTVVCFPLFACIATRHRLVGSACGFLYSALLWVVINVLNIYSVSWEFFSVSQTRIYTGYVIRMLAGRGEFVLHGAYFQSCSIEQTLALWRHEILSLHEVMVLLTIQISIDLKNAYWKLSQQMNTVGFWITRTQSTCPSLAPSRLRNKWKLQISPFVYLLYVTFRTIVPVNSKYVYLYTLFDTSM